jgi:hypothetical protein
MGFFNDLATTVSDTQIKDYLTANPNLTGQQLADAMKTYNVTPEQLVKAVGAGPDTAANVGGTFYQPQYESTGTGENFQQGPLSGLLTYSEAANKPGGAFSTFDPTGKFTGTGTQQKVSNNMLPFLLKAGLLFGGLGGGFENLLGGGAGAAGAGAEALTAADIAGGLVPEFGTNAAYDAFMASAMTPEALASLAATVAANPEIIGSGALLTDAAAAAGGANLLAPAAAGAAGAAAAGGAGAGGASLLTPAAAGAGGATLTSLLTPAAIAASALVGANASKSAAETQADAAKQANELLYKMYQEQKGLQEPFRGAGITAQNRLLDLLGLSQNKGAEGYGRYAKDFGMSDFTADPGYAFRLAEGQKTLDRQAAARGGLISGGALKAATRYGQDMGSQEYQSAFNRYQTNRTNQLAPLGSLLSTGQAAASNQAAAAGNYGTQAGGNITGAGAATAAGQVGSTNALTNALSSYLNYSSGQNLADAIRKSTYGPA